MSNIKDFDSFFKETEGKPIEFKLYGKKENLPPSLPALIIVKLNKAHKKYKGANLPEHVLLDLAIDIFGEKRTENWCKKGLTLDQLEQLLIWAMEQYNPEKAKAEAETGEEGKTEKKT